MRILWNTFENIDYYKRDDIFDLIIEKYRNCNDHNRRLDIMYSIDDYKEKDIISGRRTSDRIREKVLIDNKFLRCTELYEIEISSNLFNKDGNLIDINYEYWL